eukprot:757080-Hanusia_phi.AAC.3
MASNQAPAEEGEDEQSMPLGPQPPTLRFVPTRPMFLLNLQKYSMVAGCTKVTPVSGRVVGLTHEQHVPGRRFVDFVSKNDSSLRAQKQMLEDAGAPQTYFAGTTKCIYPLSEPFKMQVCHPARSPPIPLGHLKVRCRCGTTEEVQLTTSSISFNLDGGQQPLQDLSGLR